VGIGNPAETKFSFGLLIADYEQFLACAWDRSKQLSQLPSRVRARGMGRLRRFLHRGPMRYPYNGRKLTDKVVDVFWSMYTNGKVTGDKVGPARRSARRLPVLGTSAQLAGPRV
jgi:hypothetical protein